MPFGLTRKPICSFYNPHGFAGVQISHRQIQDRLSWFFHALNKDKTRSLSPPSSDCFKRLFVLIFLWIIVLNIQKGIVSPLIFLKNSSTGLSVKSHGGESRPFFQSRWPGGSVFPPKWNFPFVWNFLVMTLKVCGSLILSAREPFQKSNILS